ncbi:MAG: septum formation protein Maf [Flavobacterium sp. MedPE-SWcel]|uniref:Maf-like protein n=1 Tax=uncultured Flavobacterium sp. TaxID=165435 RepID=UPI00091018AA|nr:Maf-like protein [uncultured Flavobacterium sp.]OIQ18654.1 MAG: septum formation protein Maf [Flavobacterium sp. MedPE-SWcel]
MLKGKLNGYKIILASGSPRRQQFMKELDIDFEIRLKGVEEIYPKELKGTEITDFLAQLKANTLKDSLTDDEIVITSDTIVWHENKALGKPLDRDDAFEMLQSLSGKTHEVITSVCIMDISNTITFNDTTRVTFHELKEEEINYYIDNYKPFDKAGAYGIQEWIGLIAIAKIEGSYTNIVGMPIDKVYRNLIEFAAKKGN